MKLTFISDTHSLHRQIKLSGGDLLIHAGDVCNRGTEGEVLAFIQWFEKQDYVHKIFIAGNHDWFFEEYSDNYIRKLLPESVYYLNDSGIEINKVKFWGSPIQRTFFNWAFNRERGAEIDQHWQKIPSDTDILITHGPPFGILDKTVGNLNVGCEMLRKKVDALQPKIHVFGHIHEARGILEQNNTTFINAATADIHYKMVNLPINVEI